MMFYQENQILLTVGSSKSTSVSMIVPTGLTSTSRFLQCLFIQYLHKAINTIVSLQPSLPVSLPDNILRHLYKDISTIVYLLSSLLTSLRSRFLQSSLSTSLRSKFLWSYLLTSLRSKFLQSSLLSSLWNIFLRRLCKDIPAVTYILPKPDMFVQGIHSNPDIPLQSNWEFMMLSK